MYAPGEIQNFFKPVRGESPYLTPYNYDPFAAKKTPVVISIEIGGNKMEKEYLVPAKRGDTIVSVINLLNRTKENVKVVVVGLGKIASNAIITIKNLQRKR